MDISMKGKKLQLQYM